MESNYSKYKDSDPRDTVFRIQEILNRAGLHTVMEWIDNGSEIAFANRVTLYPSDLGTNGKGTDRLYSSASGYAELMERMQNNLLAFRASNPRIFSHGDFRVFPDEKDMPFSEIIENNDPFMSWFFERLGYDDPLSKELFLMRFTSLYEKRTDGMAFTAPFADITDGKVVWLPGNVVMSLCGSNGMAAGNTIEEAIVQGMCEVYERHVNRMLLTGMAVPPEIPADELRKYSVWDMIKDLESDGRYRVSVRDGSLGKGFPVAVSIISDLQNGTFCVKLGSHPSMAVAVERTLTEALQGREIEETASTNTFGSREQAEAYHNIPNIMKVNVGVYPATLLSGIPDREYEPWTQWEGKSNREFVAQIIRMAKRDGWHLLIRDNSHMGFPAVQIVVPGYTEMYEACGTYLRSFNSNCKSHDAFMHFPDLTEAEENMILRIIRFKEFSFIENTPGAIIGRDISDRRMNTDRIAAFIALKRGEFDIAVHYFGKIAAYCTDDPDIVYYRALQKWCKARGLGLDEDAACRLVSQLFDEDISSRVKTDTADMAGILKRNFPAMNCWDCEHCELNGRGCPNPVEEEIMMRIKDAMKESKVSQQELLELLMDIEKN